ncbi:hypothetical protein E4U32_003696 [Claviceps aff. humidiphila group G2b]|nr:hypothetical protein E4U32_003696 [Claviceps aff. humidiphila group G2b]
MQSRGGGLRWEGGWDSLSRRWTPMWFLPWEGLLNSLLDRFLEVFGRDGVVVLRVALRVGGANVEDAQAHLPHALQGWGCDQASHFFVLGDEEFRHSFPYRDRLRADRFDVDAAEPREGVVTALGEAARPRVPESISIGTASPAALALWATCAIAGGGFRVLRFFSFVLFQFSGRFRGGVAVRASFSSPQGYC